MGRIIPSTETPRDEVMANLRRLQREERNSRKKAEKHAAELESVLKRILAGHDVSCVDWDAMRDARALLDEKG